MLDFKLINGNEKWMKFWQTPCCKIDAETATDISSCRIKLYDFFPFWMNALFQVQVIDNKVQILWEDHKEKRQPGLASFWITMTLFFAPCFLHSIFWTRFFFQGSKSTHVFKTAIVGTNWLGECSRKKERRHLAIMHSMTSMYRRLIATKAPMVTTD